MQAKNPVVCLKKGELRKVSEPEREKGSIMGLVINPLIITITIIIINIMKLRGMRWPGHATCVVKARNAYRIPVANQKERCLLKVLCVHEGDTIKRDLTQTG
jgi:hypothetical protein